ncbi:MAG: NAD(P)/FAD-dependent oxidoreductase [Tissierellia bacterium]|nr:NAD(P)/FAD-dependent oxidoreductase [Tissierellia bacterium]
MKDKYEIAIIGTGPAGISSALTCKSRNKDFVLIGPSEGSQKIAKAKLIDNYLGFDNISGKDFNTKIMASIKDNDFDHIDQMVSVIYSLPESFFVELKDGKTIEAKSVIVATGVNFSSKIKGEDKFLGKGISFCATCDGNLYKDKKIVVLGYNQEAVEEAKFLSSLTSSLIFVNLTGNKIEFSDTIEVVEDKVLEFVGQDKAEKLILESGELEADGFFVIRDAQGMADLIPGIDLDRKHIRVDKDFSTNIEGLFACGDVTGLPYQILKAAGQGNVAALSASKFIEQKRKD